MVNVKSKAGMAMLMALAYGMQYQSYNPPDADDKVISPPQSEESKQFYIKRAQEKRLRRRQK